MKYEPVFGDQSLFDGVLDNAIIVIKNNNSKYVITDHESSDIFQLTLCQPNSYIAMRRVIAEPKRWTAEDWKDGRLPEVGCNIVGKQTGINTVLFNNGDYIVTATKGHIVEKYTVDEVFAYFSPIETPEEKAAREEDEFISSLSGADIQDGTVKDFFAQGARAAYRKLKGGE